MVCALFMDLNISAELCNFGTFTSFIIVCVAVLILRKIDPDRERPFKVPFCPLFPVLGIVCCGGLMIFSMIIAKGQTAILSTMLFVVWIIMGILILDLIFHFLYITYYIILIAFFLELLLK